MPLHQSFLSFNSGQLSPYLVYRGDFAKHSGGAEVLRNFLPLPFGSIAKRPGTRWLAKTLDGGLNSKAFGFTASDGTNYVLHFTADHLRIYREDGTTADGVDFVDGYDWPDPFSWEFGIRAMQMVQINDVAFFTHPSIHPLRLRSLADSTWRLDFVPFVEAPMLDENLDRNRELSVASNPIAATWSDGADYEVGDVVFSNKCEWQCTADNHASTADNKPGSGDDWRDFWTRKFYKKGDPITITAKDRDAIEWGDVVAYAVADVVSYAGLHWICGVAGNTDPPDTIPHGQADEWYPGPPTENWYNIDPGSGITGYQLCWYAGALYQCVSPPADFPGEYSGWEADWPLYSPYVDRGAWTSAEYVAGVVRDRRGHKYECILTHHPEAGVNEPGSGSDWETYWVEISLFLPGFNVSNRSPGTYWRLAPERDEQDFQIELAAIDSNDGVESDYIVVDGGWNLFTYGTWSGTFSVQRSTNDGRTWETVKREQASNDRNVAVAGFEETPCFLRLKFLKDDDTAGSGKQRAVLIPESASVTGYGLMDEYVDADEMRGTALTPMLSGSTYHWSEGAFDEQRGFPRAMTLHGFRLWFAGTVANPVSIWGSKINDFTNFETLTEDDSAIFRTLSTSNNTPIRWLASSRRLFLGTSVGEWVEGSETQDQPITPVNIQFREYTKNGSCEHQPITSNEGLLFLGRQGARLWELGASPANDTFSAADLSRYTDILTAGVAGMAWQQTREPCLWSVARDGRLLSFHYSRAEQIAAWADHATVDGLFRDVVVFPSDTGDDGVFFLIDRGNDTHLERFPSGWQATQEAGQPGLYVDSAFSGLTAPDHLDGVEVIGLADGIPFTQTVDDGGLTFAVEPDEVVAGLRLASRLTILPQDMNLDSGSTLGRRKRANEMLLNIFQSFGGGIEYDGQTQIFNYAATSDLMDTAAMIRSGWQAVTLSTAHVDDLQLSIVHEDPFPFTVRAAVLRWSLHEP